MNGVQPNIVREDRPDDLRVRSSLAPTSRWWWANFLYWREMLMELQGTWHVNKILKHKYKDLADRKILNFNHKTSHLTVVFVWWFLLKSYFCLLNFYGLFYFHLHLSSVQEICSSPPTCGGQGTSDAKIVWTVFAYDVQLNSVHSEPCLPKRSSQLYL